MVELNPLIGVFGFYVLGKAQLHTETAVESVEFNEYALAPSASQIDSSVQLIFCLKEVRVRY